MLTSKFCTQLIILICAFCHLISQAVNTVEKKTKNRLNFNQSKKKKKKGILLCFLFTCTNILDG
jgi:hypothetical protein